MNKHIGNEKNLVSETVENNPFSTLLALVHRLSGALDSAITGKDRSVLVSELLHFSIDNLPEQEKALTAEVLKRTLVTLKRD